MKEHLNIRTLVKVFVPALDAGGTYILVCTGIDLVESRPTDALNHIKNYLEQCGYQQPKVDVWSQNTLPRFS